MPGLHRDWASSPLRCTVLLTQRRIPTVVAPIVLLEGRRIDPIAGEKVLFEGVARVAYASHRAATRTARLARMQPDLRELLALFQPWSSRQPRSCHGRSLDGGLEQPYRG